MKKEKVKLEKFDQGDILKDLEGYGKYIECWKNEKTSKNNVPDLFFTSCHTGACFVELKKADKEVKGGQLTKLKILNKKGTRAFAVIGYKGYIKLKDFLGINLENLKKSHDSKSQLWSSDKNYFK